MPRGARAESESRLDVLKTYKLFINGGFGRSESGRSIEVKDGRGRVIAHAARGSRKDLRDAVEAANAAQPKWAGASAYHRGQVLYRLAEMMEGKRGELAEAITAANSKSKVQRRKSKVQSPKSKVDDEIRAAIDRVVCFAGWADKHAQVLGCANAVNGPYHNFTIPEPTGVVGIVAPERPALLGLVTLMAPALCAGNAVVAVASGGGGGGGGAMLPAVILAEACATSDIPPGVVNIITAQRDELLEHLAQHRNVNAIVAANCSRAEAATLKLGAAENVKRVHVMHLSDDDWFDADGCEGPDMIEPVVEMKTIWHPSAV